MQTHYLLNSLGCVGVIPASLSILGPGVQATPLAEILRETRQNASEYIAQHVDNPIHECGGNEKDGTAVACLVDSMKDAPLKGEGWRAMDMDDELNEKTTLFHRPERGRDRGEKTEELLLLFSLDGFCGQRRKKGHNGIHATL